MSRPNYLEQIKNRIDALEGGTVFAAADFADIADAKTVHMSLSRLTDDNEIRKVMRGIYMKPKFSALLNEELNARPDDVAHLIAKNFGWTIVPSDATSLNLLGLSTQVPAKWQYISDGPYKEYSLGDSKITFKHTNRNAELTQVSYKTAIVIRAIKALGQERITDKEIRMISDRLTDTEKEALLTEAKYSTSWVFEVIKRVYLEGKDV